MQTGGEGQRCVGALRMVFCIGRIFRCEDVRRALNAFADRLYEMVTDALPDVDVTITFVGRKGDVNGIVAPEVFVDVLPQNYEVFAGALWMFVLMACSDTKWPTWMPYPRVSYWGADRDVIHADTGGC